MVPLRAVIFDYGGVLRRDGREQWDAVDPTVGLAPGTLWSAWHDIPEYRLSREGAIDGTTHRAAISKALVSVAGDAACAESALAALETHLANLPPVEPAMRALIQRLRAAGRVSAQAVGMRAQLFRWGDLAALVVRLEAEGALG